MRDDVVRAARDREHGVTVEQIAKDFGVHPMTLFKWLRQAEIDEGVQPGVSRGEPAELREARKRIKLLEQENEVLRRATAYLSQANLPRKTVPARAELTAGGIPVAVTCRYSTSLDSRTAGGVPGRSPRQNSSGRIGRTRCPTLTATIQSSVTGFWPTTP
ncbi:transposase [Lentzea albidocapillata]|uniref:transposase n=1 Tax=Lentzea albidocapillata TaxID=40571 RepID=UPI001C408E14|nr:transposase [Lentzea albidocapillata]